MINNDEKRILQHSSKMINGKFAEITFAKYYDKKEKDKYEIVWIENGANTSIKHFDNYDIAKKEWDEIYENFNRSVM